MDAVIDVALPVFGIMLAGYLAGRFGILGPASSAALNAFVYWFALPPLLFMAMVRAPLEAVLNGPYLAALAGGLLGTFAIALLVAPFAFPNRFAGLALNGVSAVFANTGYMGIPLFIAAFGVEGALPALVATVVNSALVISLAIVLCELDRTGGGPLTAARDVALALVRNPLLVAPALGLALGAAGLTLPTFAANFFDLMGAAAGPCALFATGLFLVGRPIATGLGEVMWVTVLKLVVHPLITWWLAFRVLDLDFEWARAAVLMAALPTGALAFVVAQRYGVYTQRASAIILVSTVLSVATVSALLVLYGVG